MNDLTPTEYRALWLKSQSERETSESFPNGAQNGEITKFGLELPRLSNRSEKPPVTFQNKPAAPRTDGVFGSDGWLARTWWWPFVLYFGLMALSVFVVTVMGWS